MALNSGKCRFIYLVQNTVNETFVYNNTGMKIRKEQKILRVTIDNKLKFKSHVKTYVKKASQKIWALSHFISKLNYSEMEVIFNASNKVTVQLLSITMNILF